MAPIVFDSIWKKFRFGERHDTLRDLVPSMVRRRLRPAVAERLNEREFWALADVSFEVAAGEALGIIGPTGAGKSTTLKLLTRILKPTRGGCHVEGRAGALIEIAGGFHPDLTGRENIYLQGAILGMKRAEITRLLDEIVEFAGIHEFIDTPVKRYSNGMNARLGFSIAAHLNPDVLIIDEILSVGDLAFRQKCQERMAQFRKRGVAIVFVSHNLNAVTELCDRALLLDRGRLVQMGSAYEVVSRYYGEAQLRGRGDGVSVGARAWIDGPQPNGSNGLPPLKPGERVHVSADVDFHAFIRRGVISLSVWDIERSLRAYDATSDLIGLPCLAGGPGDTFAYALSFVANLTRGLYAIEINLFDLDRQRSLGSSPRILFTVQEQQSQSGIANLYLTARQLDQASAGAGTLQRGAPALAENAG